jgi:hypothetical protein
MIKIYYGKIIELTDLDFPNSMDLEKATINTAADRNLINKQLQKNNLKVIISDIREYKNRIKFDAVIIESGSIFEN